MARTVAPGTRAVIRSSTHEPWCYLADAGGSATNEHLDVADGTECVVFYDGGKDIGAAFVHDGEFCCGYFERQYVFLKA